MLSIFLFFIVGVIFKGTTPKRKGEKEKNRTKKKNEADGRAVGAWVVDWWLGTLDRGGGWGCRFGGIPNRFLIQKTCEPNGALEFFDFSTFSTNVMSGLSGMSDYKLTTTTGFIFP